MSFKPLTLSTALQLVDTRSPSHRCQVAIHALPSGLQGGAVVLSNADASRNVKAYLSGTSLIITKRVAAGVSVLSTTACVFSADKVLKVEALRSGADRIIKAYYDGTLIDTQTVSDADLVGNTRCGPFVTDSTVTLGTVEAWAL